MLIIILRVGRSSIRMERLEVESKRPWARKNRVEDNYC
jgi:hypothetical protein